MIVLDNVTKKYFNGRREFTALDGVSLEIKTGEYVAVTGRSGSGKTTLLNLIGALDAATDGIVAVDGIRLAGTHDRQAAQYRNAHVGCIFQRFNLEPEYSVIQNIELPALISGKKVSSADMTRLLEKLDIADRKNIKAKFLSGGEMQRVAVARALVNDPPIILADEPCGNLDEENSARVMDILDTIHAEGKTVILVTHDAGDARRADRIITLSDGRVVKDESNV